MVVQRTIESLRQRSREDRQAVATTVAFATAGVILIVWTFFFLRTFNPEPLTTGAQQVYTATANAAAGSIEVNGIVIPQ
jgi:hypothetical protein